MARLFSALAAMIGLGLASACSNFLMANTDEDLQISVRTKDLGGEHSFGWLTVPRGSSGPLGLSARLGFIAAAEVINGTLEMGGSVLSAGLNERGLACDTQTLLGTVYEPRSTDPGQALRSLSFCQWALGQFESVSDVEHALANVSVWGNCGPHDNYNDCKHVVVRDVHGESIVVEWLQGKAITHRDGNDGGKSGFGVLTNQPPFDWQVENVRHTQWKLSLARPAVPMPGPWYPDDRFLRIAALKSGMPQPASVREAVMQAVHVLNTITVPMGLQRGTDSGAGEGAADHTQWGVVYHLHPTTPQLWWRTAANHNLQHLSLSAVKLAHGSPAAFVPMDNELPWLIDATSALGPVPTLG